jgi:ankyrin repeat protein
MLRNLLIVFFVLPLQLTAVAQGQSLSRSTTPNPQTKKVTQADAAPDLIESIKQGDVANVFKLLDSGVDPDKTDKDSVSALTWSVRMSRPDIAELLLSRKAKVDQTEDDGGTALQLAAASGRASLVKLLIAHGANVNHKDNVGHTALLYSGFGVVLKTAPGWMTKRLFDLDEEREEIFAHVGDEHIDAVRMLLAAGADVNAQGEDCGLSTLMLAAMGGSVELGKILLAHGAKVNLAAGDLTALKFAEMDATPERLTEMLDDESDTETKQAMLNWLQFTRPGRQQFAALLRKSGAN